MKNRCYNCGKAVSPDRTCFSDGNCPEFIPAGTERKCGNCWYYAKDYFFHEDCCTVDEDDEEGTIHMGIDADQEACGRWEENLSMHDGEISYKASGILGAMKCLLKMEVMLCEDGKRVVHFLDPKMGTWEESEITKEEEIQLMRMCYRGLLRK